MKVVYEIKNGFRKMSPYYYYYYNHTGDGRNAKYLEIDRRFCSKFQKVL